MLNFRTTFAWVHRAKRV